MRLVGERRALAAAVLAFFMLQFLITGLLVDGPFKGMLIGLGLVYGAGFFGVVAGYFWARWYALGLAFSGVAMAVMTVIRGGDISPPIVIIGITHAIIGLGLLGTDAAAFYDGRRDWRERWKMDENAVNRLGKAVTRAGASLPYLVIAGLAPKEGSGEALTAIALVLGVVGFAGLVRMRTWGLLALGATAALLAGTLAGLDGWPPLSFDGLPVLATPAIAGALVLSALLPFAAPIVKYIRGRG